MILLYIIICFLGALKGLEIIPEKPEVEYFNPKYMKKFKFTIQRKGRGSPYYINLFVDTLTGCGNNMTVWQFSNNHTNIINAKINMKLYEYLGGNYIATGIQGEYKICDFLEQEPYLGKMFMSQFPANMTCPFKAGSYEIKDLVIHLENFPFNIPFTWASISVRTRSDVTGFRTDTKELIFSYKFYITVIQKPRNKNTINFDKH